LFRRRQDDVFCPAFFEFAPGGFNDHFPEPSFIGKQVACFAEIDCLAVQHAWDVKSADPLTGGFQGVFPTQGGMEWRLIALR